MNHGFIEVSHSSYGHLSLVAVGSRKGSACQAPGLQKRKRWQREKKGKHLCCRPLPSQRSLSLHLEKNHVGKNVFAHNSRAGFVGAWSRTSPSLLFSSAPFSYVLSRFHHIHPSQLFCLPALPTPDPLIVVTQRPCSTSSRGISRAASVSMLPSVAVVCISCLLFLLFGVSKKFVDFFIPSDRTEEPPQV